MTVPASLTTGEPLDITDIRNSLKSLTWCGCGLQCDADGLAEAAADIAG